MYQRIQRGRGLGGFFSNIVKVFSKAVPLVKKVATNPTVKKIGKHALSSALAIGADALQGENLKESAQKELKSTKKKVGKVLQDISIDIKSENKKRKSTNRVYNKNIKKKKKKKNTKSLFQFQ